MTDPSAVKRELERLASPDAATDAQRVVERAEESLADVDAAAEFVAEGGRERLVTVVETAIRNDHRRLATRGRDALAALDRFRRAARGDDHFQSGHGIPFSDGGEGGAT